MRLYFDNNYYVDTSIKINKFNYIIGYNGSGKSRLLEYFKSAFEVKEKVFTIDGNKIEKNYYDVYYIGECDNLDIESSLGAKSYLKQELKNSILSLDENNKKIIDDYINEMEKTINNAIDEVKIGSLSVKFNIDLNDLVLKNCIVKSEDEDVDRLSNTSKRFEYIKMMVELIKRYKKPSVLLIDEPFMNLSKNNKEKIINFLYDELLNEDVIVFITSSDDEIIENFEFIFVLKNEVSNRLIDFTTLRKLISIREKCSCEDVERYFFDEEILELEKKITDELKILSRFVNENDKYTSFFEFYDYLIEEYSIMNLRRDSHH